MQIRFLDWHNFESWLLIGIIKHLIMPLGLVCLNFIALIQVRFFVTDTIMEAGV